MSDTNTQENKNELQVYTEKGLTEKEAQLLKEYVDAGKPGLARVRADSMGTIFCLGYSCEEINKMFPEYPLGLLLHARVQYGWDDSKNHLNGMVTKTLADNFVKTKIEAARFMMEMLAATHAKYRPEILKYISNPEREEAPKVLPNTFHGYANILKDLQELMDPGSSSGGKKGENSNATSLVSITVQGPVKAKGGGTTIDVTPSKSDDKVTAKTILKKKADEAKAKKGGQ